MGAYNNMPIGVAYEDQYLKNAGIDSSTIRSPSILVKFRALWFFISRRRKHRVINNSEFTS